MTGDLLVFTLLGAPVGKGSLKCVGRNGSHRIVEDNPNTGAWRTEVARAAVEALAQATVDAPAEHAAVGVEFTATLPRPAVHYGRGANALKLKPTAPFYPTNLRTGDVDKLARLVLDALQDAEVLPDDAQVVELLARKAYADDQRTPDALTHPGLRVRIYTVGDPRETPRE
jgi:Holliday junction resolvase RusA-like endonuclease